MTVKEFVNAVTQNPNLLDLELCVVARTEKKDKGQFGGSVWVHFNPIQSATIGGKDILFWVNSKSEMRQLVVANFEEFQSLTIIGPTPDGLKW